MSAAGFYEYGGEGFDGDLLAVEFDMAGAFEDKIDLSELLVIVDSGIFFYIDYVHRCCGVVVADEGAA